MTREEEILKKAEEIMRNGEFGSLSDFEVTTHVALETAKWVQEVLIKETCDWLKNNGNKYIEIVDGQLRYSRGLIRDFRKQWRNKL